MFKLFRKTAPRSLSPELNAAFERTTRGLVLASALTDVVARHARAIKAGKAPFPVLDSPRVTTLQRWHHLRLEACLGAVHYGEGSILDLGDYGKQEVALSELLDRRAHLDFPQPSGSPIAQSIQGLWQAYLYLGAAGAKVGDHTTDRFLLGKRSITDDLELEAAKAQEWWRAQDGHPANAASARVDLPPTLFEIFFADLNRKTKSIVLSMLLGPDQAKGESWFIEEMRATHGESGVAELRNFLALIGEAENPDQALERLAACKIAQYF